MSSSLSYAVFQSEGSTWGTVDGAAVDTYLPLTSFGLKADVETREMAINCGILHVRYAEKVRRSVRGSISCPLYGQFAPTASVSFAEYAMAWAFGLPATEAGERASKSLHWFDDVSASRWSGLRVDEATLSGDAGGISLSLSLVGKAEAASALSPTLPTNRAKLAEFLFGELALEFDGDALPIESFSYTVKHGLALRFNGDYTPSSLRSTCRNESLTIKPLKTGTTYTALQRLSAMSHKTANLTLSGSHEGTGPSGTTTTLVLDFNRLAILNAEDVVSQGDYNWQPIVMTCLKPQSGSEAVAQTWSVI